MLKKLLGVILAISMVLSLFPATVSAADEVAENTDIMIIYDSGRSTTATTSEPTPEDGKTDYYNDVILNKYEGTSSAVKPYINTFTDWTKTNGFWKYAGHTTNSVPNMNYGQWSVTSSDLEKLIAFSFHVPVAGEYDVQASGQRQNTTHQSQSLAFQVFPAGTTMNEIETAMADVKLNSTGNGADGSPLGCWLHGDTSNASGKYNFETAGEYIIAFKNVDKYDENTNNNKINSFLINHFTLTNGTGTKSVPMGYTELENSSISTGDTTKASVSDLYGSADWIKKTYTEDQITYKSSNEKVATVAADGTVTGKGEGTAEIAAVINGATLVSAPLTVEAPSVKIVYDIGHLYSTTIENQSTTDYATEIGAAFGGVKNEGTQLELNLNFTDYDTSNGFWRYIGHTSASNPVTFYGCWSAGEVEVGDLLAIGINVPVEGNYDLTLTGYRNNTQNNSCDFAYQIFPAGTAMEDIEAAMKDVAYNEDETEVSGNYLGWRKGGASNDAPNVHKDVPFGKAGEYIFVVKTIKEGLGTLQDRLILDYITLTQSGKTGILPIGYTKLSANEITIGADAQATISEKLYNGNNWGTYDATGATVTYASSNTNVAEVDEETGVVTAKAVGTAEIYAIVDGAQLAPATITVTKYASAPKSLSLWVESDADGDVSVTVNEAPVSAGTVAAAAQGATVKVTAKDTGTHRFSHWLGTAGVASFDAEYKFNIYTNTALKAVYEAIPNENQAVVSFYKPNRELFTTKVVDKNTTFSAIELATNNLSLVGYTTFKGWALGEDENEDPIMVEDNHVITGDLGVVAVFDGKKTVANFKVGSNEATNVSYGQEFNEHSTGGDNFSYWKRNDHIVSYNKTYTFYAWQDNAVIKSVVSGYEEAKPVAILESYDEDTWMFEYEIPENCTRLEAGIIFGNSNDITIDSCYARAVSRRGAEDKHGQFTASSEYSNAKGYIIFKDKDNKVCVVYSE